MKHINVMMSLWLFNPPSPPFPEQNRFGTGEKGGMRGDLMGCLGEKKRCSNLIFVLAISILFFPLTSHAQSFKMDDGSSIVIENPQGIPLTQQDIEQIKRASMNTKNTEGLNKGEGSGSLAQQDYRRQLDTELNVLKSKRDTTREYDKLDRDTAKTQRLKEGKDVILYREGSRGKQDYKSRRR